LAQASNIGFMPFSSQVEMSLAEVSRTVATDNFRSHAVQFYSNDEYLIAQVTLSIGVALISGEAAIVIATPSHRDNLATRLIKDVPGFHDAVAEGRYVTMDAAETLTQFMIDGSPDPERFMQVVGSAVANASRSTKKRNGGVAVFVEMVAILWDQGDKPAAIRLEQLWNSLLDKYPVSLLCGYPMQSFSSLQDQDSFSSICEEHSHVVPDGTRGSESINEDAQRRDIARLQQRTAALEKELEWRSHEKRFRRFVDAVQDYAIFMLDLQGNVSTWNPGAQRMKGYKADEIIGKHFSVFYPEQDIRSGKPAMELEVASRDGRFEDEGWRLRKDGTKFWANVVITAVRAETGELLGFGKVTRDCTQRMESQRALDRANQELRKEIVDRKLAEQKLAESEESLRSLSLHLLRSQDEERRRIGQDLHDSLGQILTAIKMNLESLVPGQRDRDRIARCVSLADNCIKEIRTMSYLLYPPMLEELGLRSAVPWYLDGFAARSGIQTNFEVSEKFDRLPRDVELPLFRVLQEALTNVHRHSGSQIAHVKLLTENGYSILEVRDEGRGLSDKLAAGFSANHHFSNGVGLRGMDERMRQLRGRLDLTSTESGTVLRASVPVESSKNVSRRG
jgi:PAS domain S-box-containing protein